jgi:hypothetical protein
VKEEKGGRKTRYVDLETLLEIFGKLTREPAEEKKVFTFLLGMVLVQKRALKYVKTVSGEEGEKLVLRHTKSGETFEVANPSITEEEMNRAKNSFASILDTEDA